VQFPSPQTPFSPLHFRLVTVKLIPVVNYGINPLSTLAQKIPSEMKIGHLAEETGAAERNPSAEIKASMPPLQRWRRA
jgi:hypothetical protein